MSKRGPGNFGGDQERYGGYSDQAGMDVEDKPTKATAAQLARRKIAQAKKPSHAGARSRGASPAIPPPTAATNGQLNQQPANFTTNFDFQFGQQGQSQNTAAPTPSTFQFGASTPALSSGQQPNGTSNMFGQSAAPSFGSTQPQQQQNSFTFGSSFGSTQPSQQQNTTSSFGGFGQSQQNTITPATTTSSTFGSFGKPQEQNSTSSFGQPQQSGGFGGFGTTQQQEQPKTTSAFGGAGMTQQAPTQNGFTFGQKPQESTSTTFGGVGQQSQESSKPSTPNPFLGFGQKPQENGEKPSSIFANIGQKAPESSEKSSNPFTGFGQKPQEHGAKPANSIFAGVGQTSAEDAQKPANPFAGFKMQQPNGTKEKSQEPSTNIFSQPQQNGTKTPSGTQTPTASTFNLGHNSLTGQQTSKPAAPSLFSATAPSQAGQANGEPKGLFGSSLAPFETAKGGTSIFDSALKKDTGASKFVFSSSDPSQVYRPENDPDNDENGEENPDSAATPQPEPPKSGFGGTNMNAIENLPPKKMFEDFVNGNTPFNRMIGYTDAPNPFDQSSNKVASPQKSLFNSETQTPATTAAADASTVSKPRSLFDRMEPADQAKVMSNKTASPQKSLFDPAPETPATGRPANLFAPPTTSATPAAPSLFQHAQESAESQTPKAPSLFQKPTSQPSSSGLFTPAPTQPAAPSTALKAPATAPPARAVAPSTHVPKVKGPSVAADGLSPQQQARLKSLNEGFVSHAMTQIRDQDWTPILQYYMEQAAQIRGVAPPPAATPAAPMAQSAPSSGGLLSKPAASKVAESATNMFSQLNKASADPAAQTPKQLGAGSLFKPPATAPPAAKKRPFMEEDDDEPSQAAPSEKRSKLNQSLGPASLAETANETTKKRPIDEDAPAQSPGSEKRSKPDELFPKLPETASSAAKLFESSLGKSNGATTSQSGSTGGFNPSTKSIFSTTSTNQTPSAPASAPAFKPPTFAAPAAGGSFLSAFGQKADAASEKDRKKRKDEDYDSDDETPEEWEKRDREEQEAKRKKILEAAKSAGGFKYTGSTTAAKPVTAKDVEKAQGPGDNTWKPETPIKFGASTADTTTTPMTAPKFGFLNAPNATPAASSSTDTGKLAPPTAGFSFGPNATSLNTSRATTPGVTTDGEASTAADAEANADGEADGEQKEAQIDAEDMTALMPVEREENEVLMELKNAKSKKYVTGDDKEKPQWVSKGDGRAYLLKNKQTGKTRVLQKVGLNQLALNFEPVKGMKYELHPKKNTMVVATFFDHIHSQPAKLDRFFITLESADEAKEMARILTEGASK